jgi:hypothetical protein
VFLVSINSTYEDMKFNNTIDLQRRVWHAEVPISEDVLEDDDQDSTSEITEAGVQDIVSNAHIIL